MTPPPTPFALNSLLLLLSLLLVSSLPSGAILLEAPTQPERVTLLEQPRLDEPSFYPGSAKASRSSSSSSAESGSSLENWKKWTPNGGYERLDRSWLPKGAPPAASTSVLTHSCAHLSSNCNECTRHGCVYLACGRRGSTCVTLGSTWLERNGKGNTKMCTKIDKCSSHPKRNYQQLTAFSLSSSSSSSSASNPNSGSSPANGKPPRPSSLHSRPQYRSRLSPSPPQSPLKRPQRTEPTSQHHPQLPYSIYESPSSFDSDNYFSRAKPKPSSRFSLSSLSHAGEHTPPRSVFAKGGPHFSNMKMETKQAIPLPVNLMSGRAVGLPGTSGGSSGRHAHQGAFRLGFGTIIALMVCSCIVVSAVITVAVKKIRKIYTHNKSMSYGSLKEDQ